MKISVIIPAYNEAKYLGACLESIERQRVKEVCEVISVDNGRTDATVKIVERFGRDERLVCISGPYRYYGLTSRVQELSIRFYWNFLALSAYYIFGYVVIGGNCVARSNALSAIGGFDTTIAFYGDDTDLGQRLHKIGKVRFSLDFFVYTSPRRVQGEGLLRSGWIYMLNYFSVVFWHKPFTKRYQ